MNSDENVPAFTNEGANTDREFAECSFDIEIGIKTETIESNPMSYIDDDTIPNDNELQHSSENGPDGNDPENQT